MRRYGGTLIYSSRDRNGVLEVVDAHGIRSLHFGTPPRQSALSLTDPDRLELPYTRAMLSALLFIPEPARALLLGLGGGCLSRFLLHHYPRCLIDAVERRAGVPSIAYSYFGLPRDDRLIVHIAEAFEYCEAGARKTETGYDLILVDAYDHQGMDESVHAEEFFRACARLLRPLGALSMNLWGTHRASFKHSKQLLQMIFPGRAFKLKVPNRGNVIGLGLGEKFAKPKLSDFVPQAHALEIQLGLEMPYFLRNLREL
jgi:spermidine synthase